MKLAEFMQRAIKAGIEADPRGFREVEAALARVEEEYRRLSGAERERFDLERLKNPYPDTRILNGDPGGEVASVLVGIDMEVGEVLLADRLRQGGKKVDLLLSHHPEGTALAGFHRVLEMQADILGKMGVPLVPAEAALQERIGEVERKIMPANLFRAVDAAVLLELPFACAHTPADNCVASFLQERFETVLPGTVRDVIESLLEIPEYALAAREGSLPRCVCGEISRRPGKIFVDMTGGTEGSSSAPESLARAGVGTMVVMHMSEKLLKQARKQRLNVVVAGHIASDSLGMNLLLDRLGGGREFGVISCSGFRRVAR